MPGFFTQLEVPRSNIANDNPIYYDDGNALLEFYTPSHKYLGRQSVPVGNVWKDGRPSFMAPIAHYHLLQTEKFHVASGKGIWYLRGRAIHLMAGEDITIPRCSWHTFKNDPDSKEDLIIEWRYDSQYWLMEERFFRNMLTYLWDCKKHGIEPSVLQLCVFLSDCWMPGAFINIPGVGDYVNCMINALMMWTFALIGRWLYGYKASYPEYIDEELARERVAPGSKED